MLIFVVFQGYSYIEQSYKKKTERIVSQRKKVTKNLQNICILISRT